MEGHAIFLLCFFSLSLFATLILNELDFLSEWIVSWALLRMYSTYLPTLPAKH